MSRLMTHDRVIEHLTPRVLALIEHKKAKYGSAAKAFKEAAKKTGTSVMFLRRLAGRYGEVKVGAHQFFNIVKAYLAMRKEKRRALKAVRILSAENHTVAG